MVRTFTHIRLASAAFFIAALYSNCLALSPGIALTGINYTMQNNTVNLGYTITINATVTNNDTAVFEGVLDFGLRNSQQQLTTVANLFNKPPYSGSQIRLDPGESVPAVFSVDIDPGYFAPGPDVVVVWPISSQPVADSILIDININNPTDLFSEGEELQFIAMGDRIILDNTSPEDGFKQVRIYSLSGQMVSSFSGDYITQIPLGTLPKGVYICEMVMMNNKRRVIKFMH